jgi:hypothetical protein
MKNALAKGHAVVILMGMDAEMMSIAVATVMPASGWQKVSAYALYLPF